jgi:hypothetical protein
MDSAQPYGKGAKKKGRRLPSSPKLYGSSCQRKLASQALVRNLARSQLSLG